MSKNPYGINLMTIRGALEPRTRSELINKARTFANLDFGRSDQSYDAALSAEHAKTFVRRVESSESLDQALNDTDVPADLLFQILYACSRSYAHAIVIETTALPDHDRDPIARGVPASELQRIVGILEEARRIAGSGPATFAKHGSDSEWPFIDEGCATRSGELTDTYRSLQDDRRRMEQLRIRGSRPEGPAFSQPPADDPPIPTLDANDPPSAMRSIRQSGRDMQPEKLLAALLEPPLTSLGRNRREVLKFVARLSREVLNVETTEKHLRDRLKSLNRAENLRCAPRD